jgi:hypothetical protein
MRIATEYAPSCDPIVASGGPENDGGPSAPAPLEPHPARNAAPTATAALLHACIGAQYGRAIDGSRCGKWSHRANAILAHRTANLARRQCSRSGLRRLQ